MKEITYHKTNGLNEALKITAVDEPGLGRARHCYEIEISPRPEAGEEWERIFNTMPREELLKIVKHFKEIEKNRYCRIHFQEGPIKETGVNGVSNEALLAIVIDRLTDFQNGQYACEDNAVALVKTFEALRSLQNRTWR